MLEEETRQRRVKLWERGYGCVMQQRRVGGLGRVHLGKSGTAIPSVGRVLRKLRIYVLFNTPQLRSMSGVVSSDDRHPHQVARCGTDCTWRWKVGVVTTAVVVRPSKAQRGFDAGLLHHAHKSGRHHGS